MIVSIDDAEFEMFETTRMGCTGCCFSAPYEDYVCTASNEGKRSSPCNVNHEKAGFNYSLTIFKPHDDVARVWLVARNLTK